LRPSSSALLFPELLAPAGDWECAKAAVENGADAIYFGLEKFNARMRAQNFTEADLPGLMQFLHRRGVKGYVTFNTLVFENEMAQAEQYARSIIATGVDAAIVQDVGICRLLRQLSPDFPIHASTQMTITSAGGIAFARDAGCNLVVLARECSLREIEKIQAVQRAARPKRDGKAQLPSPLPLEVFIHGALCVAYSGQCLTSEALGGRSANRGECAQACRMPYDLVADGNLVPLGNRKYLLSPQDLAGLEVLPQLVSLDIASLKIEGRLKSPEYVANITRVYRQALDALAHRQNSTETGFRNNDAEIMHRVREPAAGRLSGSLRFMEGGLDTTQYAMEMAFSRGLYTGWFRGINNQELVHAQFGKKRGVYLGQVSEVRRDGVILLAEGPLKPGDGVVFDAGRPEEKEEGGRVYGIKEINQGSLAHQKRPLSNTSSAVLLTFGRGDIDFKRVHAGDKVWKTSDPGLERHLRQSFQGEKPRFQRPVCMEVHGLIGKPLTLLVRDELGHTVGIDSTMPLAKADKVPLSGSRLKAQLGRLGGTPFELVELRSFLEGDVLLPVSELNRLRREAVRRLEDLRAQPSRWAFESGVQSAECRIEASGRATARSSNGAAHLIVLARNPMQLAAALEEGIETVYCEFEDPKKYREAVACFRNSSSRTARSEIFVAPPRIFKMGEEWILKQVRSSEPDGYLIRNYDHLEFFARDRRIGDYSLNVANCIAAHYFRNKFGLERLTASYDLNYAQLEALLKASPAEWFEVTLHQHMPMFHMEHCVFCAFLSKGTDYTNCGRPCDQHDLKLRDRVGAEHPVKADAGCRNTVYNALAQTGAEYIDRMLALGVRHFRIEFLNEPAEIVVKTIRKYRQLLRGELSGAELWRELKLFNQLGVTRGQIGASPRQL
jgi:putative protease